MSQTKQATPNSNKPDYVVDLEAAYGPPSEEGFGGAVFFEEAPEENALEELAKKYYRTFVGDLWEKWGEETWMGPWKEVYVREAGTKHDVQGELQSIDDADASISVPLILELSENAAEARKALSTAYDAADVIDLRVYTIGDGSAMSGLLVAGLRKNGDATVLTVLMD